MTIPNTLTNGTASDADEVMENFTYVTNKVHQIYTGNTLDIAATGGGDTNTLELDAISSANLAGRTYLKIILTGKSRASGTSNPRVQFKIETKEIGGAYSDSLVTTDLVHADDGPPRTPSIIWYHTLTAGEKTNGVQVKLTVSSTTNGNGSQLFTNLQIIEESIGS